MNSERWSRGLQENHVTARVARQPVLVLERAQVGAGATARSAGLMIQVSGSAEKTAMVRRTAAHSGHLDRRPPCSLLQRSPIESRPYVEQ